jgi:predicted O-methyltransferase YrrM
LAASSQQESQGLKAFLKRSPALVRAVRALRHAPAYFANKEYVPPGHFYSVIPEFHAVQSAWEHVEQASRATIHTSDALELNEAEQMALLQAFKPFYDEIPFPKQSTSGFRYYFENEFYSYSDAVMLYCMMRHFRPKRVVEIGSGFSSALMLDTNERFFAASGGIDFTFIEPNPERLRSLLRPSDSERARVLEEFVQNVDSSIFTALSAGDMVFVDSSHIAKVGSDLNYIFFNILPLLQDGVLIHFHDIHYPFEYPRAMIADGVAYNEAYMLRAFLSYNARFAVRMFNTMMEERHEAWFREQMPLCLLNRGGSIWIQKHS